MPKLTKPAAKTLPMHAPRPAERSLAQSAAMAARDDQIEALCDKAPQQQCTLLRATLLSTSQIMDSVQRLLRAKRIVRDGSSPTAYRYLTPALYAQQTRPATEVVNLVPCKEWLQPAPATVTQEVIHGRTVRITRVGPPPDRWACTVPAGGGAITADWKARRQAEQAQRRNTGVRRFQAAPNLAAAIEARRAQLQAAA
jgi:hypothetical protein